MKRRTRREEEDQERAPLLLLPDTCKVVEYLEPVMSMELICKFPDNSAFDFDYSQSSIWSPLLPRGGHAPPLDLEGLQLLAADTPRKKLVYGLGEGGEEEDGGGRKKVVRSSGKKKRFCLEAMKMKKMRCKKMKGTGSGCELVSPSPLMGGGCAPFASKGWNKVLKAASKHFKKKKRDPSGHVKLSNYVRSSGI